MGTSACDAVPLPAPRLLAPSLYLLLCDWLADSVVVSGVLRDATSSRSLLIPTAAQDEKRTDSPADSLIVCIHSAIVDCTQFQCSPDHGHSSPVYATYPSPITGDLHLEDSRADSGISSFHSRPQSRCNSSTFPPL